MSAIRKPNIFEISGRIITRPLEGLAGVLAIYLPQNLVAQTEARQRPVIVVADVEVELVKVLVERLHDAKGAAEHALRVGHVGSVEHRSEEHTSELQSLRH